MPFKRPKAISYSSSRSSIEPAPKRLRSSSSPPHGHPTIVRIYIVQAKLDPSLISELLQIAESGEVYSRRAEKSGASPDSQHHGIKIKLCNEVDQAEIIITSIHMRKRFERHVDWNLAVGHLFPPCALFIRLINNYFIFLGREGHSHTPVVAGLG